MIIKRQIGWFIEVLWHTGNFGHNARTTIVEKRLVVSMMVEMVLYPNWGEKNDHEA